MSKKDLKVTLIGKDSTGGAFGSASKGAEKFSKATVAAVAAVGAAAIGAGVALFKIGEQFDKSYDTIRVGTGATGKALDGLKDDFRDVVANVPTDFASASTAIADLNTRTGQTGEPLRQLSKQMLEMTRLTGGDLSANIAGVTRVFGDWSINTDKQSDTMDYLFKVSQTTGIGIDALSTKVVQFGAPLRQLGFDFETSAAMLGKWEKEGVNTEAVLAGMKIGLGKLSKAGKEPVKALADVSAAIKGAGSAGEANRIAIETFGQRAGPDMAAAIREGRFDLDALMSTLKGSKETILGAAADTMDFSEKWTIFKNRVLLALEPIAARVFTAMGKYMDKFGTWWAKHGPEVTSTVKGIGQALLAVANSALPPLKTAFEAVGRIVVSVTRWMGEHKTTVGVVAAMLGTATAAIVTITAVTKTWAAAQAAMNLVLALNPIGLVIVAVAALVGGLIYAYQKSETFRDIIKGAMGAVKTAFIAVSTTALGMVDKLLGGYQAIADAAGKLPGPLGAPFRAASEAIGFVRNKVVGLKNDISGLQGKNVAVTADTSQAKAATDALVRYINSRTGTVRVAGVNGLGGVTARAHGGPVWPGKPYLVGEEGPELIVPRRAGHVMTAQETAGVGAASGRITTVNIYPQEATIDGDRVVTLLQRAERLAGF